MLKRIELENFRIFAERVSLQLRPITVLIGRNSAGKSTLIKFLLMLQQSLDASEEDFLKTDGDRVKLGDFSQLRNSRRGSGKLQFKLEYSTNDLPDRKEMALFLGSKSIKRKSAALTDELRLQLTIPPESQIPQPNSADVSVSGLVAYRSRSRIGTHHVNVVLDGEEVLREVGQLRNSEISLLRFPARSSAPEKAIQRVFSDRFLSSIRHELSSMQHLGAVREESSRVILASNPPSGTVGQRGQFALPHLREIMNEGGEKADFVQKQLADIADVTDLRFKSAGRGYVADAMATNVRTNMKSYLSDFGFGVGQCLPIVVQGAITSPGTLMMVEQPESQLHPTAQLSLGSFFCDLWKDFGVTTLIETHSSQLILRLRTLVAEGNLDTSDVTLAYVDVDESKTPTILNLEIEEGGRLKKGLPMEFFGADVLESMKLGVKK
jgi:ABC-type ATPase involved in cell division